MLHGLLDAKREGPAELAPKRVSFVIFSLMLRFRSAGDICMSTDRCGDHYKADAKENCIDHHFRPPLSQAAAPQVTSVWAQIIAGIITSPTNRSIAFIIIFLLSLLNDYSVVPHQRWLVFLYVLSISVRQAQKYHTLKKRFFLIQDKSSRRFRGRDSDGDLPRRRLRHADLHRRQHYWSVLRRAHYFSFWFLCGFWDSPSAKLKPWKSNNAVKQLRTHNIPPFAPAWSAGAFSMQFP